MVLLVRLPLDKFERGPKLQEFWMPLLPLQSSEISRRSTSSSDADSLGHAFTISALSSSLCWRSWQSADTTYLIYTPLCSLPSLALAIPRYRILMQDPNPRVFRRAESMRKPVTGRLSARLTCSLDTPSSRCVGWSVACANPTCHSKVNGAFRHSAYLYSLEPGADKRTR